MAQDTRDVAIDSCDQNCLPVTSWNCHDGNASVVLLKYPAQFQNGVGRKSGAFPPKYIAVKSGVLSIPSPGSDYRPAIN